MRRSDLTAAGLAGVALLAAGLLALAPAAAGRGRCVPAAGPLYPVLTSPCNGGRVRVGHDITFRARDENSESGNYHPFIELTNRRPHHGKLPQLPGNRGFLGEMHPVRGHPGEFAFKPNDFSYPGYWLVTPGTYYVQIQQVDVRCGHGACYGPISKIHVT